MPILPDQHHALLVVQRHDRHGAAVLHNLAQCFPTPVDVRISSTRLRMRPSYTRSDAKTVSNDMSPPGLHPCGVSDRRMWRLCVHPSRANLASNEPPPDRISPAVEVCCFMGTTVAALRNAQRLPGVDQVVIHDAIGGGNRRHGHAIGQRNAIQILAGPHGMIEAAVARFRRDRRRAGRRRRAG